jgi:hypothetical protein
MSELDYSPQFASKLAVGGVGQIPRELDRQQGTLAELHETLAIVEDKLSPIRLAKPEPSAVERDAPEPTRADVAQAIALGTQQIEHATRRLRTLLNELEV